MTTRWPLHPAPVAGEALSSWLHRIARQYSISYDDLITDLGYTLDPRDLDVVVPAGFIDHLSLRTGVACERIHMMSLRGYVPWLMDGLEPGDEGFSLYTRQFSVLLSVGRRRSRKVTGWRVWTSLPNSHRERLCPQCLTDTVPPRPYRLVWSWPVMLTCPFHHCFLETDEGARGYYFWFGAAPPASRLLPAGHPVSVMDGRTWQALTLGYVDLPRRRVHAGVWFRLLRTIIDELGVTRTECGSQQRVIQAVWDHLGYPFRAGRASWQPYERLTFDEQQQTLEAAAAAMHLLETTVMTGRGSQAAFFLPEPDVIVAPGRLVMKKPPVKRRPSPAELMKEADDSFNAMLQQARHDPATAQDLFHQMSDHCPDQPCRNHVRRAFILQGVPAEFLTP